MAILTTDPLLTHTRCQGCLFLAFPTGFVEVQVDAREKWKLCQPMKEKGGDMSAYWLDLLPVNLRQPIRS